jgi:hypothetical protein
MIQHQVRADFKVVSFESITREIAEIATSTSPSAQVDSLCRRLFSSFPLVHFTPFKLHFALGSLIIRENSSKNQLRAKFLLRLYSRRESSTRQSNRRKFLRRSLNLFTSLEALLTQVLFHFVSTVIYNSSYLHPTMSLFSLII